MMDTYATSSNKRINHSLMLIHSYLSWAVVAPASTGEPAKNANMCLGRAVLDQPAFSNSLENNHNAGVAAIARYLLEALRHNHLVTTQPPLSAARQY